MRYLTLWERRFFKDLLKSTLFILLTFYGIYVLIDYANHAASLRKNGVSFQWDTTVLYYLYELIFRINVLLPFALMLASIRMLCNFNVHHELVALMTSGMSLHRLMRPLLFLGILCSLFIYINNETFFPFAVNQMKKIEDRRSIEQKKTKRGNVRHSFAARHVILEDFTTLLFQSFDSEQERFFDVYWLRNVNEVYRIKYLYPNLNSDAPPSGHYVDHLVRDAQGHLVVVESLVHKDFPIILFNKKALFETLTQPEEQAISELWSKLPSPQGPKSEKESLVVAAFYQKLMMPWLCLLVVMAIIPSCTRITRHLPIFFIYAGAIFGFVAFNVIMNSAMVLAKRQTLPVLITLWVPFSLFAAVFLWRYLRLRRV